MIPARRLLRHSRRQDRRRRHASGNDRAARASSRSSGGVDAAQGRDATRSTGFAISIAASARNGCGSRGTHARRRTGRHHSIAAGRSLCAGRRTAATKACSSSISRVRPMRTRLLRRDRKTDRQRRRPLADEPRAGDGVVAAGHRVWVHTCTFDHPAALAFPALGLSSVPAAGSKSPTIRGSTGPARGCGEACAGH